MRSNSLWIRQLELYNFGPYEGKVTLDFATNKGKGIWIIWGMNGAGKTHLYKAIKWCLYGWDPGPEDKPRFPTTKDAWDLIHGTNREDGVPADPYMHVYMWLQSEDGNGETRYLIKRLVKPLVPNPCNHTQIKVDFDVIVNGRLSDSPNEAVQALLPLSANQFFMFHGEDIRKMSQKHLEQTRRAIELILEAETFRLGRSDLEAVSKQIDGELDRERAKNAGLRNLLEAKRQTQERIDLLSESIKETEGKIEACRSELSEVEYNLSSMEGSSRLMGQLEEIKKRMGDLLGRRRVLLDKRNNFVDDLPLQMILPLLKSVLEEKQETHRKLEETKNRASELKGRLTLAQRILTEDKCVCGRPMSQVERAYIDQERRRLESEISSIEASLQEEDPTYYEVRETIIEIEASKTNLSELEKEIRDVDLRIDEVESERSKIEEALRGINIDAVSGLSKRRSELIGNKAQFEERLTALRKQLETEKGYMFRITSNIKSNEAYDSIKAKLERQQELCDKLVGSFEYILSRLAETRREAVEKYATDFFRSLTNKPEEYERIRIDANYDVNVVDRTRGVLQGDRLSTGEREIVALSFIIGLMKASEKDAPLVLDTFFVHLDETHYANIVKALPSFGKQIVLILTDLEFRNLREKAPDEFFSHVVGIWRVTRDPERNVSFVAPWREASSS
jgi:DNA sulfur modification protein DndD